MIKPYLDLLLRTTDSRFGHISILNKQNFQAQVIFLFFTPLSDSMHFFNLKTLLICPVQTFAFF
jgi:hypothetical protein